jgi:hypothetical protein
MSRPAFTRIVAYTDKPKVAQVNVLYTEVEAISGGVPLANYTATATLSATKELADSDASLLLYTASGADRTVELAPEATTNNLLVKDDAGAILYGIIYPGQSASFYSTGAAWKQWIYSDIGYISGLRLTWVSTTAFNVEPGAAYIYGADKILNVATTINKTGLSLSNSTWYHVYLYESSGAAAVEVVTTAPAAAYFGTARAKTADTSRRYLGSVLTNGSGHLYKFAHDPQRNLFHWLDTDQTASPFRVLSAGTASSATSVAMTGCAPATAFAVALQVYSNGDKVLRVGNTSSLASTAFSVFLTAGNVADKFVTAEIPVDGSGNIYYRFDSAVGSGGATIDCYGFVFER